VSGHLPRAALVTAALAAAAAAPALAVDPLQRLHRETRAGHEALAAGDLDAALEHFAAAEELAPGDPRALYNLAHVLARQGRQDDADRLLAQARALAAAESLRADAAYNRSVLALEQQRPADAVRHALDALAADPAHADARRNLELALRALEQPEPPPSEQPRASAGQPPQDQPQPDEASPRRQRGEEEQQPAEGGPQPADEPPPEDGEQPRPGADEREEPAPEPRGDGEQERAGGQQQRAADAPAPAAGDDEGERQAEQLLERLDQRERDALREALRKRAREEQPAPRQEKDW
jgi:hypothetical protein